MAGTLYIVSTPIGNLEDMTFRAVRILKEADLIAAEDTRTTGVLLKHYEIGTHAVSFFARNEIQRVPQFLDSLREGKSIAVVSDAGTPGISDPAARLISAAIDEGIQVVPIPGASALLAALVASGLRMDRFHFEGFLPQKKGRQKRLGELAAEPKTIVLYESVHRVKKALAEILEHFGDRHIAVCRELTKLHEEVARGRVSEILARYETQTPRGEFVLIVEGHDSYEKNREITDA